MHDLRAMIARVAVTDARVLITGESGTGKELVAAAIHAGSPRRARPLVRVNCAAIPRDLVESEMFGHERGSFTGATERRIGRFELAHTGTLLLDEVADLGAEAQAKLLRAIEAKEIERVGGGKPIRIDVRIVAATNRDLARAVRDGNFREDLYFRLNVLPVEVAPLRERPGDVSLLVRHFAELQRRKSGQTPPRGPTAPCRHSRGTAGRAMCASWRISSSDFRSFAAVGTSPARTSIACCHREATACRHSPCPTRRHRT